MDANSADEFQSKRGIEQQGFHTEGSLANFRFY